MLISPCILWVKIDWLHLNQFQSIIRMSRNLLSSKQQVGGSSPSGHAIIKNSEYRCGTMSFACFCCSEFLLNCGIAIMVTAFQPTTDAASIDQHFQCPQAERARRSEPSQGPSWQMPVLVSASISTISGVVPGCREPLQRSQLAQRLRATRWFSRSWRPCMRRCFGLPGLPRRQHRSSP